ncbi:hypothetical protein ABL78_0596 [Leptomonas seymouri]|uniref:Uncharacterized protein n=1 Tax=Leptomonas seymouri TaxID=5684 RepID=A0A0N1IBP3_LEPSE|nr:hypothetical protein ABL78_0596 [Leptomonas seymouri]|eukprot:KPI90214.1 hypothetical protein ABL78_0596 [Leptomonas seymouri]
MAVQRRALYRLDAFDSSEMQLYDLSQRLANGSHLSINDSGHSLSEVTWSFLSFFAALSCPTPLELSASTSEKCRVGEVSRHNARSPHTTVSLQNVWYCPDVVVMLAMVRSALCLSHNSFPEVRFEQKAVHDPARRVRELTVGLYGDVDIFTKVHIEWITPRGTFVASAESDPARHSTPCGGRGGSSQWLSCKDTGYPRGPLPLLVAAVCSLFDQVVDGCVAALQHYPTIPVQEPFSRKGLDFLFYSWFGATPQVRCFAIGTAAPMAEAKASADSKWLSAPDGFTSTDLGASMIRAMLFYDVLGQRVLFAETHASDVADAVARLEELAMKVNQINQDGCIPASAAGGRPFRSIARLQQWKGARERFERAVKSLETSAAPDKSSNVGPSVATMIPAASSPPWTYLLRRCIGSCTSEVSALWTVVEMLAMVLLTAPSLSTPPSTAALGSDVADRASADVLVVRFTPDGFLMEELAAVANSGCGEDELRWLGRRYVPWNCRPLGKETTPPPAGVVELLLKTPAPKFPETSHTQGRGSASEVSFRCRVDPLGSISGDEDRVLTGVLPALTVLCREALLYVYAEGKAAPKPILSQLPSVEDLLRWCAAADPVLARDADGFPPYEAQFYAAPKLLGELLQGVAGKYSCSYAVIQPRANRDDASIGNSYHGVGKDALSASASSTATPAQPSTVFYRSEALLVDLSEAEAADGDSRPWSTPRCDAAAQCAPPSVECTLFIDSIMGSGNHGKRHRVPFSPTADASNCSPDANSKPVIADAGYVLGRGVGRTKREAWRSAAWQALRLQFPHALAQLEVLRDVTELTQHPDQLNLLLAREDVANALVTVSTPQQELPQPAFPVCGLSWKWRAARSPHMHCAHSSNNPSVDAHHSGEWTQPVTFVCSVDLLHADNSRTPLPEAAAVAASAGEACVLAGKRLLQMAQGARHKKPVPASLPSSASSVSHTAWGIAAGGWGVGSGATRATATGTASSSEPNRQLYYANWRPTTHFTKSIWHAYAGALSLYFGEDMIVELLCDLRDEHGDIKDTKYPQLRTPARVFDHLSVLQVRARKEEVCPSGVEPAAASRVAGVSGDGDGEGPTKESAYHVGSGSIQSNGLLFRQTPASLMARLSQQRSPPPPPPPSSPPSAKPPRATSPSLPLRDKSQPFQILREISWWLSDLVQLCAMPLQTRKELRGLLLSRIRDAQRIQRATRWSPADRVKAMMLRWTGCHTEIRICRQNLISSSKTDSMWAAEVLIQICVLRQRTYSDCRTWRRSVAQGESHELGVMALAEEPGMWVAGRAVAATSDEAVWQLYCDVCEAMRHAAPENLLTEGIGAA